ncbi:MAG TPA: proteasome subunit alpha [Acidimicrobiia bacterium]|nr:proteasome subunit alpha [Acidimicrobiia bacterium]
MSMPFYVAPEQLVRDKAEFARKGIARGRSIIAVEYATGLLLMAENPSRSLRKIAEVYDRIAFAGVGRYNEYDTLRKAGVRQADLMGYLYSREDVNAMALATAFAQTLGSIFSHELKPYEVEILIAELGREGEEHKLYRVSYDGTLSDERHFAAIGGKAEELVAALEELWQPGLTLEEALDIGTEAFRRAEERESEGWELVALDAANGRRTFRRLDESEIRSSEPASEE